MKNIHNNFVPFVSLPHHDSRNTTFAMTSRYVLKLVIVVLTGVGLSTEKDDIIFAFSMATSFGALIYFGLKESI